MLIYQGLLLTHSLTGLEPFSLHTFRVVACTSKGCGSSRQITGRTMEAPPSGFVVMEAIVHNPRTINVKWTPPDVSNGIIHYKVLLTGLFYEDPGTNLHRHIKHFHVSFLSVCTFSPIQQVQGYNFFYLSIHLCICLS